MILGKWESCTLISYENPGTRNKYISPLFQKAPLHLNDC